MRIRELAFIKHSKQCLSHHKYYTSVSGLYKVMYVFSDPAVRGQDANITRVQDFTLKKGTAKLTNEPSVRKHKPKQVAGSPDLLATTPSIFLY